MPTAPSRFWHEPDVEERVLVVGATSFIGSHCVAELLRRGYRVRGSVRDVSGIKSQALLDSLPPGGSERLELVAADLLQADGWDAAVAGCTFVLHIASPTEPEAFYNSSIPIELGPPEMVEKSMVSAVGGTLLVIDAAKRAGVRRVVLTSSQSAMLPPGFPHIFFPTPDVPGAVDLDHDWSNFVADGTTWTDEKLVSGYPLAKVRSERAAWEAVAGSALELVTILPGVTIGPPLHKLLAGASMSANVDIAMRQPRDRRVSWPAMPNMTQKMVDVRDVARAHVQAMRAPAAAGVRYPLVERTVQLQEMMDVLAQTYKPMGYECLTRRLPFLALRVGGVFNPILARICRLCGIAYQVDSSSALKDLQLGPYIDHKTSLYDAVHASVATGRYERRPAYACDDPRYQGYLNQPVQCG